ncbi:zinc finger protein [Corallococcus sicarius]|uniref:RanBP2-type domain-containing protein n=1 Tax=Corallococcus sicarius TaxID=2316726 RepID=A0A3A8MJP3_9BACT|nr:zinc finger protein [Corallococcus sicarius]RKH31960.1 hypothetical protein D7X12_37870 [Corallococcus sicarius]
MAERRRIIEGSWNCTSCGARNIPARHKNCPSCNNPRELTGKESEFDFGDVDPVTGKSTREGVTDAQALDLAGAGEDWFCAYCGASNRGDAKVCRQCSAERGSDAKAAPVADLSPKPPPAPAPKPRRLSKAWIIVLAVLGSCCFGTCAVGYWGNLEHDLQGEVVATSWRRAVVQERFVPETHTGWRDQLSTTAPRMPVNGAGEVPGVTNIRGCVSRQRGTRRVADGTERVCRTKTRKVACGTEEKCSRRDKGNGFVEEVCHDVTKYCNESYEDCQTETRYRNEPVYAQQCDYDTYAWKQMDQRELKGTDEPPRWPQLSAGANERVRREESYRVSVRYEDDGVKEHVLEPTREDEFLQWKKGQGVTLTVTNLGKVEKAVRR